MTLQIKPIYQGTAPDDPSPAGKLVTSQYNAGSALTGTATRLIGTDGSGNGQEVTVGTGFSYSAGSLAFDVTYGDGRYAVLSTNTFSGNQTVGAVGSVGAIRINVGDGTGSGYIAWYGPSGTRYGFAGYVDDTNKRINFSEENGGSFAFSSVRAQNAAGGGYITLHQGDGTNSGYVEFYTPDNVRRGYLGYGDASYITFSGTYRFDTRPSYAGNTIWDAGNLASPASTTQIREKLTANRTYYVRTDGSDSNDGLANTSGGAKLTLNGALFAVSRIDLNSCVVTIQVGAGTYSSGSAITIPRMTGLYDLYSLSIIGDPTTPSNVVLQNTTSGGNVISVPDGAACYLSGFKLVSNNGNSLAVIGGSCDYGEMDFGATYIGVYILRRGWATCYRACTISGDCLYHIQCDMGGQLELFGGAFTFTGSRTVTGSFVLATGLGIVEAAGSTFTGTLTGVRYYSVLNGVINTFGSGVNYFPGNAAGSTGTGGQYA